MTAIQELSGRKIMKNHNGRDDDTDIDVDGVCDDEDKRETVSKKILKCK